MHSRIDDREHRSKDRLAKICRSMQRDIEAYHGDEKDMKRRMKCHFEQAMKTQEGKAMSNTMQQWELLWALVCTEVSMKICARIVSWRFMKMPRDVKVRQEETKSCRH